MWLLKATTRTLEHFASYEHVRGEYAIVSHTWADDEVTFQDVRDNTAQKKKGFAKVEAACLQALRDGLSYVWCDTACIDKTSSAELSEAINSMFSWYWNARLCYAYLSDVPQAHQDISWSPDNDIETWPTQTRQVLAQSRWFTRGWTLQELLAPQKVIFYDTGWNVIGTKAKMVNLLSEITAIHKNVLADRRMLFSHNVAARMSWAAHRSTTRTEDRAYSLLGIFDVNIPLLYGEGEKAFLRLQEEIIKTSLDFSILAWDPWGSHQRRAFLSPSPYGFRNAHDIVNRSSLDVDVLFSLSNRGLTVTLETFRSGDFLMALLPCHRQRYSRIIALQLAEYRRDTNGPKRGNATTMCRLSQTLDPGSGQTSFLRLVNRPEQVKWLDLTILDF